MNIEEQAREQGWVPKEEWKGEPEKWSEATVFVEKGEKVAGILKSRVDKQTVQIEQLQTANQAYGKQMQGLLDKERQKNAGLLAELEEKRAAAINDSDGQEFNRLNKEIETVQSNMQPQNVRNPQADAWLAENSWYNTDSDLQAYADGICDRIESEGYTGTAYWSELTRRTKVAHPDKFSNRNKDRSNGVEQGGSQDIKNSKDQSYDNLPEGAKAACDSYVESGLTSKEDYVKNYEWDK